MKKEKKLNNKGFTLIEVLAVIVILVIIVSIAIPNISASLDRQSCTIMDNKGELIASAAQFYVSANRGTIKGILKLNDSDTLNDLPKCKIDTDKLIETKDIVAKDLGEGNEKIEGYIVYNNTDESYTFCISDLDSDDGISITDSCNNNDAIVCSSSSITSIPDCY